MTRGHGGILAKKQLNGLSADCVGASSVNMFKNNRRIPQKGGVHLDRSDGLSKSQRTSTSTCHLELILKVVILVNLVKSFEVTAIALYV